MSIKIGDMVIVVGASCDCAKEDIGTICTVGDVSSLATKCPICSYESRTGLHYGVGIGFGLGYKLPEHIKKLPPLDEDETITEREELTA